jgi:uncharacterized sporulation protein YeaH/YhbH (DUF444 family)
MSSRKGLIVQVRLPVEEIPEPNRHIPLITVDLRVYFPPNATKDQIQNAIIKAMLDMSHKIDDEELPGPLRNVWLVPPEGGAPS